MAKIGAISLYEGADSEPLRVMPRQWELMLRASNDWGTADFIHEIHHKKVNAKATLVWIVGNKRETDKCSHCNQKNSCGSFTAYVTVDGINGGAGANCIRGNQIKI
ncbi:hypothetical protein N7448_001888 [Penicillium atrosanguineum]|uniref:Uncharacterized protein n=1 Tax=Penicillium atrosanguineum TaxID=1132637 RepID=A0A9W9HJ55_9EURO|nr:uncharacterized protein N7443_005286 [Penicillium atrosanguineum]KAJ5133083.1 hypothetical protein N7526_004448 [Penicillium atrosanguineum]KAJ5150310.1 hypothetical protein N7448_001888 [Penicillium atrosanguineum]KAJ5305626.1 hypothetical protein N7443_005286 [Penicillium atrosanguineum]KAJ5325088.1 hypothetical protein N7476_003688 [Penicillium atrosanguineum]